MTSYQYRKSYCGDKTILRPSYLHNGISYTGKTTSLYWIRAQELYLVCTDESIWLWHKKYDLITGGEWMLVTSVTNIPTWLARSTVGSNSAVFMHAILRISRRHLGWRWVGIATRCGEVWRDNTLRKTCCEAMFILSEMFVTHSWDIRKSPLAMCDDTGNAV